MNKVIPTIRAAVFTGYYDAQGEVCCTPWPNAGNTGAFEKLTHVVWKDVADRLGPSGGQRPANVEEVPTAFEIREVSFIVIAGT